MNPSNPTSQQNKWHTSCFGLFDEPLLLLESILFPCRAYKKAAASFSPEEDVGCIDAFCGGACFFCGFDLRVRFREELNLQGNREQDFCIHLCCHCCGLAQIQREARHWKDVIQNKQRRRNHGPQNESIYGVTETIPQPNPTQATQRIHQSNASQSPQRIHQSNASQSPQRMPWSNTSQAPQLMPQHGALQAPHPMAMSPMYSQQMNLPVGQTQGHPMSPFCSRNIGYVAIVPRVPDMTRDNTAPIDGHRDQNQLTNEQKSQESFDEEELSGLEDIDQARIEENLSKPDQVSPGHRIRVINHETLEALRRNG
eukprot:g4128.t1